MSKNTNLQQAKSAKADEFYTQLTDIEKELKHYKAHFNGATVLCNCDDPRVSNFFRFFEMHFEDYGLKRLITTCYKHQDIDLFGDHSDGKAVYLIYDGDKNGNGIADPSELDVKELKGDGDFRSQECIDLLKQADIVVTNPPFSLFREYVAQLMEYGKKFLIIGHQGAIGYTEIFPLIKNNKIWLGASIHNGDREFEVPLSYNVSANYRMENGRKFVRVRGPRWFTNLDYVDRHEPLILYRKYNADDYPHYENYDAIDVNKTSEIPEDYWGIMGVPVTFMDKYCPEQFEIIGNPQGDSGRELGLRPFNRELKKLNPSLRDGQLFYMKDGYPVKPFTRILIRRKQ